MLEKEDGPGLRFRPHLKIDIQDMGPLNELSEAFNVALEFCDWFCSKSDDLEWFFLDRTNPFAFGLVSREVDGSGLSGTFAGDVGSAGILSTRWNACPGMGGSSVTSSASSSRPGTRLPLLSDRTSSECRRRDDVMTAEVWSEPDTEASRPSTPRSRFGNGTPASIACLSLSALRASLFSTFSCSRSCFLCLLRLSRSISSRRSLAFKSSARSSTRLCALSVASGICALKALR